MTKQAEREDRDQRLMLALLAGRNQADAARESGWSERTARRRLVSEPFRRRLAELRGQHLAQVASMLSATGAAAVVRLRELLDHESAEVQLRAAKAILESLFRTHAILDVEARLAQLEEIMAADATPPRPAGPVFPTQWGGTD